MNIENDEHKDVFVGTWVAAEPFSEDFMVEYSIARLHGQYEVTARDYQDGEQMEISDVKFDGNTLEFVSLMPSTGRKGINRFTVKDANTLATEFTFTVIESLRRV